jgi:DNA-binding Xre family transcriptional regulator
LTSNTMENLISNTVENVRQPTLNGICCQSL